MMAKQLEASSAGLGQEQSQSRLHAASRQWAQA